MQVFLIKYQNDEINILPLLPFRVTSNTEEDKNTQTHLDVYVIPWSVLKTAKYTLLTVIELQHFVVDGGGHGDGLSREVWVVIEPLSHRHSCWWVAVSRQKAEHVILSAVSEGGKINK